MQFTPRLQDIGSQPQKIEIALSVHRHVEAVKKLAGKRMVRILQADSVIDLIVVSPATQKYWLEALQRQDDIKSPTLNSRTKQGTTMMMTRMRTSFVQALLDRSDLESQASTPSTPLQKKFKDSALSLQSLLPQPPSNAISPLSATAATNRITPPMHVAAIAPLAASTIGIALPMRPMIRRARIFVYPPTTNTTASSTTNALHQAQAAMATESRASRTTEL